MKRIWFFDLDGTLADTDRDIREAWKATLADLGVECPNFDRDFVAGPPIDEMARHLLPGRCTDDFLARLRRGFGDHYDHDGFANTREYPGVLERVKAIKATGARVFIATNKRLAGATLMAAKFGWDAVFDGLYTGDMFVASGGAKMRKDELLAYLLKTLGVVPEECVMVGDTSSDFDAARANGIESVGVTWGYGRPEELATATRIAADPRLL